MSSVNRTLAAPSLDRETFAADLALQLDDILALEAAPTERTSRLEQFLTASTPDEALLAWFGSLAGLTREKVIHRLNRDIAAIDAILNDQVNAILHAPELQRLEASWRGLEYLVEHAASAANVKVRILSASWREIARDQERAIEFDQSVLFRKVYSDEFGTPGGEPFGLLIGDYELTHRPSAEHPTDDIATLTGIAQVAAASFAPFIAAAAPTFFGVDTFSDMQRSLDLNHAFEQPEFIKWKAFRKSDDARFVGLTVPRVIVRAPYEDDGSRADRFRFAEDVLGVDHSKYLWGNAAYAFAAVVVRAFDESGWLADIRGIEPNLDSGGVVHGLPAVSYGSDPSGVVRKVSTDLIVTDAQEKELGELGFIPLCACRDTHLSAFYSTHSVQLPKKFDEPAATANAKLSAMLHYILCVSRFAHYLKVIGRDRVGAFATPEELEKAMHDWLLRYAIGSDEASDEVKARYPLREAKVEVREHPAKPGVHMSVIHLRPHYQLDQLSASLRLVTELSPVQGASLGR